jgi:hypothetical protein|tara:strand:+ start:511 stop:690 length:180 start_codon:yes stop_codon:yes gene_type:complete
MAKLRKKATHPPRTKDWKNKPEAKQPRSLTDIIINSDTANLLAMKEVIDTELARRDNDE